MYVGPVLFRRRGIGTSGHQHDGEFRANQFEGFAKFRSGHVGHVHIGQEKMDCIVGLGGKLEGSRTVGTGENAKLCAFQNLDYHSEDEGVVIDDEDCLAGRLGRGQNSPPRSGMVLIFDIAT